ncbi:MAG: hypothetical protein PHQ22_00240 [Sulfuricurvum sp.]|nr:hypothetical protein [Sulfuricurvum sp.]MDD5385606.1 hypothetical protein [Sulfuricurvum sp.]
MTMTITVNDSIADKVMAFLNTFPKEAVKVEQSRPWYTDEVKNRADEYRSGKMETVPHNEMWERIERQIEA